MSSSVSRRARTLRLLVVTPRFYPQVGGIETHVYEVGRRLAAKGIEVTVLTTDAGWALPHDELVEGMHVRRVPAWPAHRDYHFAPGLWHEIMSRQWDVMHCQGIHTFVAPLCMLAARRARLPYLLTFHTGGDTTPLRRALRPVQWQTLRPLLAHAVRLIGPSKWEVRQFQTLLRLPAERFAIIPNGAQHLPAPAVTPAPARGVPLIVSLGRLERYKGHHRVIAAMPHVLAQVPYARLRIVGVGAYEATLRRQIAHLGLADHVEIVGVPPGDRAGMATLCARADLVTLLSEHEAQGIAVLEALALGRPVLVAESTALSELVVGGLARSVSLRSTPEQIAAAILSQLRQPLIPAHVALPTWEQCVAQLVSLYDEAAMTAC